VVVCQCERVTERRVTRAVRDGAQSLRDVSRETGAGQGCGGCVSSLRRILEQYFGTHQRAELPQ
jgi:bacterioferritin-associated ferredoxin